MIYFELLQKYSLHCTPEELEMLIDMDNATNPIHTILQNWQGETVRTIHEW